MNTAQMVASTGLFTPEQATRLEALLGDLGPQQALWLSGYLAALGTGAGGGAALAAAAPGGAAPDLELTVLYGTETGNCESVAELLVERARGRGLSARAADMAGFRPKDLRGLGHLALVSATHGEGDPPDPARGFFEFLASRKAPSLEGTKFAVLSLGDSSYVEFCRAGRELDARLEALGAGRLLDRVDCDVDYHDAAHAWVERLVDVLSEEAEARSGGSVASNGAASVAPGAGAPILRLLSGNGGAATPAASAYSRQNPFPAEVLDATLLTGLHSDKETFHLELAVDEGALAWEPGDSLGVIAENEDAVLDAVLGALDASTDAPVRVGGEERPLGRALKHDLELTLLTPAFLQAYAEVAAAEQLREILGAGDRHTLLHFMKCHQVADVLQAYPVRGLDPQVLVDMLRRLQPRLYSIASSAAWLPDQVDLTVAVLRRTADGKRRNGVASTYLWERRAPGDRVRVYVDRNKGFKLPPDPDASVIMIGAGTGVAPYRAFLQERSETGARGRNWLFFGERRFREDFLYQTEWQRFLEDGVLTRMDVAFSRDRQDKVYVQHRIEERARDVWAWLEEGAHVYVCGDASGMAPGVEEALLQVVQRAGGRSAEDAGAYLRQLKDERRYQKDVY